MGASPRCDMRAQKKYILPRGSGSRYSPAKAHASGGLKHALHP